MAHRHNRRRARRPRSQINATAKGLSSRHSLDQFVVSPPTVTPAGSSPPKVSLPGFPLSNPPTKATTTQPGSNIPARLWQNRYAEWQEQEERARAAKFEAQQIALFGGEPGDDVELCYRMLEFFGGLDYIS